MRKAYHRYKTKRRKPYHKSPSWGEMKAEKDDEESIVGCTGKHRYPDLTSAHAAAHYMCILQGNSEAYMYLCTHCGGYHLTKAPISPDGELNRWAYFFGKE